ncbi:MAG: esterase/lipase family protein [Myxococcota bacterium]
MRELGVIQGRVDRRREAAGSRKRARVLLLHGFASSPRVMGPLASHLHRRLGRPTLRWAISPGREDLRASAAVLSEQLERLDPAGLEPPVDVVAHSMGGLVAAYWLKRIDRGRRIARVVTLGTPHRGAPVARFASWILGGGRPALHQMCPGSALLAELDALSTPGGSRLVSVAGGRDVLVKPEHARIAPSDSHHNLCLAQANHWSLLFAGPALETVARLLERPAVATAPPEESLAA